MRGAGGLSPGESACRNRNPRSKRCHRSGGARALCAVMPSPRPLCRRIYACLTIEQRRAGLSDAIRSHSRPVFTVEMLLPGFDPIVSCWFTDCVGVPTAAQQRGWASIRERRHTLIAAPTGSGKTLAAFLTALDALVQESQAGPLPDEVRVLYVSPLKALSTDIHKNLAEPRRAIRDYAA